MLEYLLPVGIATGIGIGLLLFFKFKQPPKQEFLLTREKVFQKGEGPRVSYDVGLGGSPFNGRILKLQENGEKANIEVDNEDGTIVKIVNIYTGVGGNLKLVSSDRELLHGEVKFLCNKDATGETKILPDGSNWTTVEKSESQLVVDLLAEARANANAIEEFDDVYQQKSLRRKSKAFSPVQEETDASSNYEVGKYG